MKGGAVSSGKPVRSAERDCVCLRKKKKKKARQDLGEMSSGRRRIKLTWKREGTGREKTKHEASEYGDG